jgi:FAD/FMN-containing dehydrogenase
MALHTAVEIHRKMAAVVGPENVKDDPGFLSAYFLGQQGVSGLVVVLPAAVEEVQGVVRNCASDRIPLFTTYDTYLPDEAASASGVVIDFCRMNAIERIDAKNLCVHIQRGVTFEQLEEALRPQGLAALYPAAATTRSVLCHAVSRGINQAAARYPEVQVANMQVVLQDGSVHRTGSHANSEEMADWKEDGGPNISKWYLGADDVFGIVVCGSVWVYPRFEGRYFEAFGFEDRQAVVALAKDLARMELAAQCLAMNREAMAARFGVQREGLSAWTLLAGTEGFRELAAYHRKKIVEFAAGAGGRRMGPELADRIASGMSVPWYVRPKHSVGFYTLFGRIPRFEAILEAAARRNGLSAGADIGMTYLAYGLGRAVSCRYDLPEEGMPGSFVAELERELALAGAFFDRPRGALAEQVYGSAPAYAAQIKKIKAMMDPRGIFNPGRPFKGICDGD